MHNDIPCTKSQNDFCCFRRLTWLLTRCFNLLGFLTFIVVFFILYFSNSMRVVQHVVCTYNEILNFNGHWGSQKQCTLMYHGRYRGNWQNHWWHGFDCCLDWACHDIEFCFFKRWTCFHVWRLRMCHDTKLLERYRDFSVFKMAAVICLGLWDVQIVNGHSGA